MSDNDKPLSTAACEENNFVGIEPSDVLDGDAPFLGPDQQLATDVFRAIVDPDGAGLSAPFYDAVQAANDPFRWQRKVDFDAQALAVKVIQHVQ